MSESPREGKQNFLLRQAREERSLSQLQVAEAIGVDERTYRRWENEGRIPGWYAQQRLLRLFRKTTPDELGFGERTRRTSFPSQPTQQAVQEEVSQVSTSLSELSPDPENLSVQASPASLSSSVAEHQEQENDPEIIPDQPAPFVLTEREHRVPTPPSPPPKKRFPYTAHLIILILLIAGVSSGFWLILRVLSSTHKLPATATAEGQPTANGCYERLVAHSGIMFGFDAHHSRMNPCEQILSPSTVGQLVRKWIFATNNAVVSSPVIANDVVYVGSNDGNLYAVDAATGNQRWLFSTNDAITSSPAIVNDVVYVGSHNHHLYAINVATGR